MTQRPLVVVQIREMILQGALSPGQRVAEAAIAERLGISRTPVRQALPVLAQEGLLVEAGARGYAVRGFTLGEINEAIELRGVLEGMAARALAERGAPRALLRDLRICLDDGDLLFADRATARVDADAYGAMNARFHDMIIAASDQALLVELLARVNRVPFVTASAIAFDRADPASAFTDLWYAHRQHHAIVDAIAAGQGARAEALLREHVQVQRHSMNLQPTQLSHSRFSADG